MAPWRDLCEKPFWRLADSGIEKVVRRKAKKKKKSENDSRLTLEPTFVSALLKICSANVDI